MGSGKTTVSEILSDRLELELMDTDATIEDTEGRSISSIFREDGEEAFRDMETDLLSMIAGDHLRNMVISLGGGMPVREINRTLLKESGKVIYLKATPETIYERVKGDTKRPLLQAEDPLLRIKELLEERSDAYDEAADLIIDTDNKTPDEICDEIIRELGL